MEKPVRKAVKTFIIQDGEALAIKYLTEKNNGFYDIPGGKIEAGETNFDASIRECLEETGIQIINQKYIGNLIIEYPEMIFDFDVMICNDFEGNPDVFEENKSMWIKIEDLIKKEKRFPCIDILKSDYKKYFKYGNFKIRFIVNNNHKIIQQEIIDSDCGYVKMWDNMDRKVVIITGGSRGIGAATVEAFAKADYNVVINYVKNDAVASTLKTKIESLYSVSVLLLKGDISKEEDVNKIVQEVKNKFGRIDVLVNNAGIAIDQILEDKTVKEFKRVVDVNLVGTFLMSKEVGKVMLEQGYGKIINVASTNGIDTIYPESIDYDASKAGVISLTKNLALAYAPVIQVNAVAPGWVKTQMNQELEDSFIQEEERKILLGRFAHPSEIASVIYFLTTNEASYINGTVIRIDGGFRA